MSRDPVSDEFIDLSLKAQSRSRDNDLKCVYEVVALCRFYDYMSAALNCDDAKRWERPPIQCRNPTALRALAHTEQLKKV